MLEHPHLTQTRIQARLAAETDAFVVGQLLEEALTEALSGFRVDAVVREEEEDDEFV